MKKVLLVSASKSFLNRNASLFMNHGFQFFTAFSGLEALKLHEELDFDLILCELKLEDMDGCRFCSEVHMANAARQVPVILICYDNIDSIEKVKQSDASAILLRPLNPTHLLITIGSFIDMQLARKKRVAFNATVLSKIKDFEFLCTSRDISIAGILLETEYHIVLGNRITCQFTLPDISQIQSVGEVIRCFRSSKGKTLYGVKFIDLPVSNRSAIAKYITINNHLGVKERPHRPLERSLNYQQFP